MTVPWQVYLEKYRGIKEIPGPKSNPIIDHFASFTTLRSTSDEIPWCSSAMCAAMEEGAGIGSTKSAAARSWISWHNGVRLKGPCVGAIVIFNRGGSDDPTKDGPGHVSCVKAFGRLDMDCVGGNQGDTIKDSWYGYDNVLAWVWPKDFPLPEGAEVIP